MSIQSHLNTAIKDIRDRLYSNQGGAATDYANFCTASDFNWIREEIESEFENFNENFISNYAYQLDMEEDELEEELEEYSSFIEEQRISIMNEIDEIDDNCGTHKIYDYIKNQIENRFDKAAEAFEKLEEELIKKGVVEDLEELAKIDSYIKAKRDFK